MPSQVSLLKLHKLKCSFRIERQSGCVVIAGIDEVGRGCLAGPVVVGGVVFDCEHWDDKKKLLSEVNDSKKIKAERRTELAKLIRENARAWAIAHCDSAEIDRINILQATFKAARAVFDSLQKQLNNGVELVLMDGPLGIPGVSVTQKPIIGGDSLSRSIAAASIIAKVERDLWMTRLAEQFPQYLFEKNKGYGTSEHLEALKKFGPCSLHRRSFLKKLDALTRGREAEDQVQSFLQAQGFEIVEKNWKSKLGEIDLIARRDGQIRFVEVRYRSDGAVLELAFPRSKQLQFQKAVSSYLMSHVRDGKLLPHYDLMVVTPEKVEAFWDVFRF